MAKRTQSPTKKSKVGADVPVGPIKPNPIDLTKKKSIPSVRTKRTRSGALSVSPSPPVTLPHDPDTIDTKDPTTQEPKGIKDKIKDVLKVYMRGLITGSEEFFEEKTEKIATELMKIQGD